MIVASNLTEVIYIITSFTIILKHPAYFQTTAEQMSFVKIVRELSENHNEWSSIKQLHPSLNMSFVLRTKSRCVDN